MGDRMKVWCGVLTKICGFTLALLCLAGSAKAISGPAEKPIATGPTSAAAGQPPGVASRQSAPPDRYTLTPEKRAKAVAYARTRYALYFLGVLLALGIYFFLWRLKIVLIFRNWAGKVSPRHYVQCLIFAPLFFVTVSLMEFPLDYYSDFVVERRYGLSTQTFVSWLGDWGKALGITTMSGVLIVWILYAVIRRSPRRWWFYFWLVSVPLTLGLILIEPVVIDPLFFKFTPLEKTKPALTARIEVMLHHAGLEIPASRIFEMNASAKTNALNAYVNGVGASKRVVVWDTTLRQMNEDETLLVLGHEMGHYVLNHVIKGFILFELGALAAFWIGFLIVEQIFKRLGPGHGVEGVGDLASLPILLLVLTMLSFFSTPVYSGLSRYMEHQADQFGLEVAYGVVPDPNAAEAQALQILGEQDLEDPAPGPFIKFWLYTHPPLDERIRFAASYKPWAEGKPLELVPFK
ncbi:MAG: M48 family metallopeptidase [Terriglobia bacterium]